MRRAGLLTIVLLSCGGVQGARSVPKTAAETVGAQKCTLSASHNKPLVVDWAQDERTELEAELKERSLAVVRYDCKELRVIPECKLEGDYGFTGVTRKESVQHFEGDGEIALNLPLNGLSLAGQLGASTGSSAALDVALVTIGQLRSTRVSATRADLRGSCAEATHFVRAIQLGAFAVGRAEKGHTEAAGTLFKLGASARTSQAHKGTIVDGAIDQCASDPNASAPPAQCGAPLRLDLVAIGEPPPGDAPPACPGDAVWTGDKCVSPSQPHQCKPGDGAECDAQCKSGNLPSCHELGKIANAAKDPARAFKIFEDACGKGYMPSCNSLGAHYALGDGVAKDDAKAIELYTRACDDGNATACSNLGGRYIGGDGVLKNTSLGARLIARSCDGGEPVGCFNLGTLYRDGSGVPKDLARAFAFIERSCVGSFARGCSVAALMQLHGEGTNKDPRKAIARLEKQCDDKQGPSCMALGGLYAKGDEGAALPADPVRVRDFMKKGCAAGESPACAAEKLLATVDKGDAQIPSIVMSFKKQCDGGDLHACALLGEDLVQGIGTDVDRDAGVALLKKACAGKIERACAKLKEYGVSK